MPSFFKRISVQPKLILIAVTFVIPASIMLFFILRAVNKKIVFVQMEQYGLEYQRPLEGLLDAVPLHWQLARQLVSKHPEVKAELAGIQARVDQSFTALDIEDKALGAVLQFTEEGMARRHEADISARALRATWDELKTQLETLNLDQCNEQHQKLLAGIRSAISYNGEASNLIVDPEMDSYYLMNVTLTRLPKAQERISSAIGYGEDVIRRNSYTTEELARLEDYASRIETEDIGAVSKSIQTATVESPNFGKSETADMTAAFDRYAAAVRQLISVIRKMGKTDIFTQEQTIIPLNDFKTVAQNARKANFKFWNETADELNALLQKRADAVRAERNWSLTATALALLAASVLVVSIIRSITGPFSRIMGTLNVSAAQVTSASGQLSSASQSLAGGATEQASSLEETSSSLEEMSSMIGQNADSAAQARKLSEKARQAAQNGDVVMIEMKKAMSEIEGASADIAGMIRSIEEIAFQTNLLALNAAVQAARAGDGGRGFAVVADEIRRLAQRSAVAARESTTRVEAAVAKSKLGIDTSTKVAEVLQEIGASVKKTADLVSEIAAASQEQSQGIKQINSAVQQMDKIVQSNAANSEQTASAAVELEAQAKSVQDAIEELSRHVGARGQRMPVTKPHGSLAINRGSRSQEISINGTSRFHSSSSTGVIDDESRANRR